MTLRYLSMFAGIEAASVAWAEFDLEPVAFAEVDRFASAVLAARFPGIPNLGDVTRVDWAAWRGRVDVVIGGPPCQDFSVAGQRAGAQGARGNLSLVYARAIHAIRPLWAITENVPGWLSMGDNAFGAFLGELVGADAPLRSPLERGRWPDAGMAAGPGARVAWRVLDAQHFGLAQRRARVFIVAGLGDGADPAAVLFERKGVPGNLAAGGGAGEDAAGAASPGAGGGGPGGVTDFLPQSSRVVAGTIGTGGRHATGLKNEADALVVDTLAFGGNNTAGPIDVASACRAKGGSGHGDFESETFVVGALTASCGERGHGGSGLATNGGAEAGHLVPVWSPEVADPICANEQRTYTHEGANNFRTRNVMAFTQNSRSEVRFIGGGGEVTGAVSAEPGAQQQTYVAFSCKDSGQVASEEIAPTLRAMSEGAGNANAGGQVAVALCEGAHGMVETPLAPALQQQGGKAGQGYAAAHTGAGQRRLTPRECERLQGFPDDWTLIPYRGAEAKDGPRYKSIGNSMATPVVRWIGRRILAQGAGR